MQLTLQKTPQKTKKERCYSLKGVEGRPDPSMASLKENCTWPLWWLSYDGMNYCNAL